jgi:hypothetical protein
MAFFDLASNRHRCSISVQQLMNGRSSETGKYFAGVRVVKLPSEFAVDVWDTDPPGRWLLASVGGLATFVVICLILYLSKTIWGRVLRAKKVERVIRQSLRHC